MARTRRAILQTRRVPALRAQLESLVMASSDNVRDPIHLVKRYTDPADVEVAAVFASALAFGRVEAFLPVTEAIVDLADTRGGPARWVAEFDESSQAALAPMLYRWIRGSDLTLLARTLGHLRREHGSLYAILSSGHKATHTDLGPALDHLIVHIRQAAVHISGVSQFSDLSRGFRHALPRPSSGSGCKRWNMLLRWMVRSPTHPNDPDMGLWDLPRHKLVIPVDTHVLRVAKLIGLTHRTDGSWRTAQEITANLRKIHPEDPVRYDFALAHLGISGGCRSRHIQEICTPCPLSPCCRYGRVRTAP